MGEETATAGLVTTSRIGVLAESVRYTVRRTRIAHGQGITTTDVTLRGKGYGSGAYCDDFGGTSSATPLVAGIAALVLSANRTLKWTAVRNILRSSADKIDKKDGRKGARRPRAGKKR